MVMIVTTMITSTVSFHNFKSQNVKLSVSNPKNNYVAYLSVLSQISNCQSLGNKNKHDILKADRASNDDKSADSNMYICICIATINLLLLLTLSLSLSLSLSLYIYIYTYMYTHE